jgi:hypothetical protein
LIIFQNFEVEKLMRKNEGGLIRLTWFYDLNKFIVSVWKIEYVFIELHMAGMDLGRKENTVFGVGCGERSAFGTESRAAPRLSRLDISRSRRWSGCLLLLRTVSGR